MQSAAFPSTAARSHQAMPLFAIAGDNRDGHGFVEGALKAGAGVAVVAASKRDTLPKNAQLIVVEDVLEGLRDLARARRGRV